MAAKELQRGPIDILRGSQRIMLQPITKRTIFQTWKDKNVPSRWRKAQASVVVMNPTWDYVLLTDEDNEELIRKHFPMFLETFVNLPHDIQRADAVRYAIMYVYGGVYIDLDYVALKPFDSLFSNDDDDDERIVLITSINTPSLITNSFMASRYPKNVFWLWCIESVQIRSRSVLRRCFGKHLEVFGTTGPFMLDAEYRKAIARGESDIYRRSDLVVPCNACNFNCKYDKGSKYMIKAIEGTSWVSWDTKLMTFAFCNGRWIIITAFVIAFVLLALYALNKKISA